MSRARDLADGTFSGAFSADSPTLVVDDANNRVGVGTASPTSDLTVKNTSNSFVDIISGTSNYAGVRFGDTTDNVTGGVYFNHSTNALSLYGYDNAERMTIDSSGNLGVGASSPSAKIHSVDSNGNVLRLQRDGAFTGSWDIDIGSIVTGDFTIYDNENAKRAISIDKLSSFSGTSALYIRNNGAVLINETSPWRGGGWFSIDASGRDGVLVKTESAGIIVRKTAYTNGFICLWENNGGSQIGSITTNGSTTAYNTSSDYRLKENITDLEGAIDRVKQIPVRRFNFIDTPDATVDGFIAHEVQSIVPEAVHGEKDAMTTQPYEITPAVYEDVIIPAVLDDEGNEVEAERTETQLVTEAVMGTREVIDPQGIDQSKLVPLLTAAIKEQQALIEDLQTRLAALEAV